jgi:hypothetical protein
VSELQARAESHSLASGHCSATIEQTFRIFHHDHFKHLRQQTSAAIAKKQASDMPGE